MFTLPIFSEKRIKMKNTLLFVCLLTLANTSAQGIRNTQNDNLSPTDRDEERYNRDNKVYKSNTEFVFDYVIVKNGDSLKCQFSNQPFGIPKWKLVKPDDADTLTVQTVSIAVLPYYLNDSETGNDFRYYNKNQQQIREFEATGLIENDKNTWLHPPRSQFFPFVVGTKWTSGVSAGYFDSYQRFNLKWEGVLNTYEELEIIDKVQLPTALGVLPCYVVQGISKSTLTETKTVFYYNEDVGFVKIVYDLFDKSRLEFNLKEIKKDIPLPNSDFLKW
jgi:hypothetical protein